jgi:hypothetical protein
MSRRDSPSDLIKGATLDVPFAPLISPQRLLPRFARLARYAVETPSTKFALAAA